jgi:hypothetical protein
MLSASLPSPGGCGYRRFVLWPQPFAKARKNRRYAKGQGESRVKCLARILSYRQFTFGAKPKLYPTI